MINDTLSEKIKYLFDRYWDEELTDHMNLLKIDAESYTKDPAMFVRDTIGYEFINENLLRQAFTRRAFAVEYGLPGCNEELEFLGDTVLNTVVTRDMLRQLAWVDEYRTEAPFTVRLRLISARQCLMRRQSCTTTIHFNYWLPSS